MDVARILWERCAKIQETTSKNVCYCMLNDLPSLFNTSISSLMCVSFSFRRCLPDGYDYHACRMEDTSQSDSELRFTTTLRVNLHYTQAEFETWRQRFQDLRIQLR